MEPASLHGRGMVYVIRSFWTLVGLVLLSFAFTLEFDRGLVGTAFAAAPTAARQAAGAALGNEPVVHITAAVLSLTGFFAVVTSWPVLISLTVLLGRGAVSLVGGSMIGAAAIAVFDPTFLGLLAPTDGPPVSGEDAVAVVVYAAAAMLAFIGLTIAIAPWRRTA